MARLKTISTKAPERKVFTVSELNFRAKQILESELRQIWLEAEISNLTMASSGHWYFSLKDSKSQVSCAMFRGSNRMTTIQPKEGMKVLVRGRVSLYEPRGNYQLIVEQMSLAGEGDLLAKYEALKKQLSEEGLFDESIKQPIAPIYQTIGIISSPTGAAVHDVLSTIRRRFPLQQVVIYPSLVQGEQAVESIRGQLATAIDRNEVDVILLVRGGGAI
ncbi:MAG: exodeoxyribonuclease VII large subunit, partial [Gammaproteobacteria bacterium]